MQRNGHGFLQPVPCMLAAWSSPAITLLQSATHQRLSMALHQATFSCTSPACRPVASTADQLQHANDPNSTQHGSFQLLSSFTSAAHHCLMQPPSHLLPQPSKSSLFTKPRFPTLDTPQLHSLLQPSVHRCQLFHAAAKAAFIRQLYEHCQPTFSLLAVGLSHAIFGYK